MPLFLGYESAIEMLCYLGDLDPDLMREKAVEVQSDK